MTRRPDSGVTLVEVLVALSVVAAMASVTLLSLGGTGRGEGPEAEARRLAGRLQLAVDEALVTGQGLALDWSANSYGFVAWDAEKDRWVPSPIPLLARRTLPDALRLDGGENGGRVPIGSDGTGAPFQISVVGEARAWAVDFDGIVPRLKAVLR